jgi:hypothetical protein
MNEIKLVRKGIFEKPMGIGIVNLFRISTLNFGFSIKCKTKDT